jgi:signal transduction histidine kinase/ligand-binding sensor domain-containing protein/DNA-binding response OmpR family regulator
MRNLVLFFLVLLSTSPRGYSQNSDLPFETLSVDQGMPTTVTCILQDNTGYLWFGTYGGLYRYDGYGFVSYKHNLGDTSSIVDSHVTALYEDKAGVLWIGTLLGLDKLDRTTGAFSHYTPNPSNTGEDLSNSIGAICEDRHGVLWVATEVGLDHFDRATGKFTPVPYDTADPGSISDSAVMEIYEGKEGSLWFATGKGLDGFDFAAREFVHYWHDPSVQDMPRDIGISRYWINALDQDDAGILWLGTMDGLVEFNPKNGTFSRYRHNPGTGHNCVYSICQDVMTGSLWLATGRGLLSFDRKSKAFVHYDYRANAVCSERSGTLWVGTDTYIQKLNRGKPPFKKYAMSTIAQVIKSGKEGILWVKIPNAYLKFDIRSEKFVPFSFGKDAVKFVYNSGGDVLLYSERGIVSTVDSAGVTHVWGPYSKAFMESVSITWKSSKGYWIGTGFGDLFFLDFRTKRLTEVRKFRLRIQFIYEDSRGLVWIATFMGKVFCYDQARDTVVEFRSDPKNASTISGRQVNEIYEDTKGRLWFATNNGLNKLDRSTNSFVRLSERVGLPSNDIRGILEDDHGCLWITTNKGISKFDPETNHFRHYDASYGLEPTADVFFGKGCRTRNGEMYFGGAAGFTRFHPDSVDDNPFIPPIVITSFTKFDKPCQLSREIRLPHNDNFIAFEFAALSYISPERNQYAYKMEGLDKEWVYSGTRRYASYPNLEPGEYAFRVKGSNNDGVWNEAGTSISIVISPPWWKTTWAYILYSLVVLSVLYAIWKMQVKRMRVVHEYEMSRFEAQKLHEVDELKSRFFANISHEFRTPLTLILGPVKQIIQTTKEETTRNDLRVVHKNANRLLGLVNQLLDISKLESGNMKLHTTPQNILPFLRALVLSFASYAERKRITLTFNSTENELRVYIDEDKIEKIITNILSNAFTFTPDGGRIGVVVTTDARRESVVNLRAEHCVIVSISDTGVGIPANKIPRIFDRFYQVDGSHTREQGGTGIGLSLTKELVELHKGTIEVESEEGKGTTFTITLPLGKEHLKPEEICEADKEEEKTSLAGRDGSCVPEKMVYHEGTGMERPAFDVITEADLSADKAGKPLLLIVEDNADVRYYISSNVNKDFRILEAMDGEDGWNKSITHMPDVIVSDVMMPKMDGFKLCDRLKTDERTSHIPVILLTAKASSQDKIEGLDTGADDYIMKPFEPEEVKARIRNLVEQRKRIHEHFRKHGLFEIEEKKITPVDRQFLERTVAAITKHISDVSFGVESLAAEVAVSRSVLLKKIEALVGEPPSELIKRTRLDRAAKLIEEGFGNISEIALEVGFNNPSYFAECFRKQFGLTPSQYHRGSAGQ